MSANSYAIEHGEAIERSALAASRLAALLGGLPQWAASLCENSTDRATAEALEAAISIAAEIAEKIADDLDLPSTAASVDRHHVARAEV